MNRMSNRIAITNSKCDHIDEEIDRLPECLKMREKLCFYKEEGLLLG